MAYADFTNKIILKSFNRFKMALAEAAVVGDLIDASGNLADAEDTKPAAYVVCEAGAASAVVTVALAAVIRKAPTVATGGGVTQGDHGGTLGTVLYLDGGAEQGKAIEASGTIPQQVGWVLSQDRVVLMAMAYILVANDIHLPRGMEVNDTTALDESSVITGDATLVKGNVTMTEGNVAFSKGQIRHAVKDGCDEAYQILVTDDIICCELTAGRTLTLPDAAAGLHFTIIHKSGAHALVILTKAGDKLLDNCGADSDGAAHDKATDDAGLDCYMELVAVDAVNWVPVAFGGGWTFAD